MSKYEILRPECFLAMHDHVIARTERDRAFVGRRIESRDVELTEVLDTESGDIDVVSSQTWSCATDALAQILDLVVTIIEIKHESVVPSLGIAEHHLSVAPHVIISGAADQFVIPAACVAGHRLRVANEGVVVCTGL